MKVTLIPIVTSVVVHHQRFGSGTGGLEKKSTHGDNTDYIDEIGQKTNKPPGDLLSLRLQ